ncbi:MAG: ABC transporter substrate-binding protein [Chloroflexota bacterium]|nr:extracellular solute-binding protein [Anaerolineales bacterium]
MKQKMFYILSLLLIGTMILSACGAQAPATPAATQAPATEASATEAPATEAPAGNEPVELTMWTWKLNHVPGLEAVAKNFEAETGIKVTVSAFNPDDAYRTKLTTSAQSGDLPDIMSYWTGGNDFWNYAGSGVLVELTDKVDAQWKDSFLPGTYDKSSIFSQARYDTCQADPNCTYKNVKAGQSFSVPYMAGSAYFVYASKPLMEQAGLDPNTAPKTAEEWRDMMVTIKEKTGVAGVVTGVQNPDVSARWLFNPLLMTSCGQETFDAIYGGKESFQSECAQRVFDFVYSLSEKDLWTADILQTDIDPADAAMAQGKAAFDIGGTYTLSGLLAHGMKAEDILAFAVPPLEGSKLDSLAVGVDGLIEAGVTKDSKHPEEAIQFLKFLTSPEQASVFAKTVGDLPAVKLDADPEKVGSAMAGLIVSLDPANAPFGKSTAEPFLDEIFNVLRPGLQAFITGETTPEQLAQDVQEASVSGWENHGGTK